MLRIRFGSLTSAAIGLLTAQLAFTQCASTCSPDGKQASGAIYRICMPQPPSCYNGNLLVYAHGYVDATQPVGIPEEQLSLPDGRSLPELINGLGFAFATSSYRRNGLAVLEGVEDLRELVDIYQSKQGAPQRVFIAGPSEGGLVTAKSIEKYPNLYAGGLAACGPIGNFRAQIDYIGDFRTVFDYLFPGLLPGNVTVVPEAALVNWSTMYEPRIRRAVQKRPDLAAELIRIAKVPISSPNDIEDAIVRVAWYTIFAVNDIRGQLGGQPYDNIGRWYSGSRNDLLMNLLVYRVAADPRALANIQKYETSGLLSVPVVTMHTTADPVIPYWHELLYRPKVESTGGASKHVNLPVFRYGHCQFTAGDVLFGFGALLVQTAIHSSAPGVSPVTSAQ